MILRLLATILWVPAVVIVITLAVVSGLLVAVTALMIPAVRWLAKQSDI